MNRILNNIVFIYKTKGTIQSINALFNCFGIDKEYIKIYEGLVEKHDDHIMIAKDIDDDNIKQDKSLYIGVDTIALENDAIKNNVEDINFDKIYGNTQQFNSIFYSELYSLQEQVGQIKLQQMQGADIYLKNNERLFDLVQNLIPLNVNLFMGQIIGNNILHKNKIVVNRKINNQSAIYNIDINMTTPIVDTSFSSNEINIRGIGQEIYAQIGGDITILINTRQKNLITNFEEQDYIDNSFMKTNFDDIYKVWDTTDQVVEYIHDANYDSFITLDDNVSNIKIND